MATSNREYSDSEIVTFIEEHFGLQLGQLTVGDIDVDYLGAELHGGATLTMSLSMDLDARQADALLTAGTSLPK